MSKYDLLWEYVAKQNKENVILSYDEIEAILSFSIDHSFLNYKKELIEYGYEVGKISMKNRTVEFKKVN